MSSLPSVGFIVKKKNINTTANFRAKINTADNVHEERTGEAGYLFVLCIIMNTVVKTLPRK